jgi:two-component system, LuxR family, sensor kinase FixL
MRLPLAPFCLCATARTTQPNYAVPSTTSEFEMPDYEGLHLMRESLGNIADERRNPALGRIGALGVAVLEALPGAIAILDRAGTILHVNSLWRQSAFAVGAPTEAGANYIDHCRRVTRTDADFNDARAGLESVLCGSALSFVQEIVDESATEQRWFELRARSLTVGEGGAVITLLDITERKRNELDNISRLDALARATRAVTIGALGGSLTHELNQPMTAILSNAQAAIRFLNSEPGGKDTVRQILHDIVADAYRAGEIIRRTRQLLKGSEPEGVPLDVNEIVQTALGIAADEALLRKVHTAFDAEPDLPLVHGDPIQLQQVVLNLVLNAFDAMENLPRERRSVKVRTRRSMDGGADIIVADSGPGIEKHLLAKIFGPFYTTKPTGMGMGLYVARAIVQSHGGTILATPNDGYGVALHVHLPLPSRTHTGTESGPAVS